MPRDNVKINEKNYDKNAPWGNATETIRQCVVLLQAETDALYAKLDADGGVAGTNYAATLATSRIPVPALDA